MEGIAANIDKINTVPEIIQLPRRHWLHHNKLYTINASHKTTTKYRPTVIFHWENTHSFCVNHTLAIHFHNKPDNFRDC